MIDWQAAWLQPNSGPGTPNWKATPLSVNVQANLPSRRIYAYLGLDTTSETANLQAFIDISLNGTVLASLPIFTGNNTNGSQQVFPSLCIGGGADYSDAISIFVPAYSGDSSLEDGTIILQPLRLIETCNLVTLRIASFAGSNYFQAWLGVLSMQLPGGVS